MKSAVKRQFRIGIAWLITSVAPMAGSPFFGSPIHAQDARPAVMSSKFVPDDGVAIVTADPSALLKNPVLEWFPVEVFRVQAQEQMGIDPAAISMIKAVAGLSAEGQPRFGVVVQHDGNVNSQQLMRFLGGDGDDPVRRGERDLYRIDGPEGMVFCPVDANTLFIGMTDYVESMIDADEGTGPLPNQLLDTPLREGINAIVAMETIRPIVSGMAMQQSGALAPPLQPLARLPELTDAIKIHLEFDRLAGKFEITLVGTDEAAAKRIESILSDSLVAARELAFAEMRRSAETTRQSAAVREATEAYANRIADRLTTMLKPNRIGDHVTISAESEMGVAGMGVVAGMLLPAIQAARQAARRMDTSNNFKQVMLAMHNYHSAYNQLPLSAIVDEDDKPLLSCAWQFCRSSNNKRCIKSSTSTSPGTASTTCRWQRRCRRSSRLEEQSCPRGKR